MKKILITAVIAMAATTASAFEVGVQVGRDFGDTNRNFGGLTVGQSLGPVTLSAGYHRTSVTANDQNRWSVVGGYDLVKVGPVQFAPTVGAAYLNNKTTSNGLAMTVGVEASVPVSKSLEGVVDYTYQIGQSRVNQFDGSRVTAGLRYKF